VSAAPAPKKEKGGKKWLVGLLIGAALAVVVAVVLVLMLVVFKGGGPESAARDLYKAMEKKDVSAIVALVDTSDMSKQSGLKDTFTDYIKNSLGEISGLKFSDLKFKTTTKGDNATVTTVSGKITYKDENGKMVTENISKLGEDANIVYVVKKDGKWYVDTRTFPDFYATQYLKEADSALEKLSADVISQLTDLKSTIAQGLEGATTFPEIDARMKALAKDVDKTLASLRTQAEETKAKYQSVESLQGVRQYQNYAKYRAQSVDALKEMIDKVGQELEELSGYMSGLAANPPTTEAAAAAVQQGVSDIENKYNAQFDALQKKIESFQSQANELMDTLGL
jgi:phage shock protein A